MQALPISIRFAFAGLVALSLSLAFVACGSSSSQTTTAPPSERLYLTLAKFGTLTPADGANAYTLSMTDVPKGMIWFDDRPLRGSGTTLTADFIAAWETTYAKRPPQVLVDTYYRGTETEIGFYMSLTNPVYDADKGELTVNATLLATTLDTAPTTAAAIDDIKVTFLDEAADGTTDHWSFAQVSKAATLADNGDGTLTLTLTGVPSILYAVGNAPNVRSFVDQTASFVDRWNSRFGDAGPNVAMTTYLEDDTIVAMIMTLNKPVYDAATATLTYQATLLLGDNHVGETLYVPTIIIDSTQVDFAQVIDSRLNTADPSALTFYFSNTTGKDVYVGGQGSSQKKLEDQIGKEGQTPTNVLLGDYTGFKIAAGKTVELKTYDDLNSGVFWARTGCGAVKSLPFTTADGTVYDISYLECDTGTCIAAASWIDFAKGEGIDPSAGLQPEWCFGTGGAVPRNVFEITVRASDGVAFADLSNIDGYVTPIGFRPTGSFTTAGAATTPYDCNGAKDSSQTPNWAGCQGFDLATDCPAELQFKNGAGEVVGCMGLGKALADNNQRTLVEAALKERATDSLNSEMIASFKSRFALDLATLGDIFDDTGTMITQVQDLYECGCGSDDSGCGLPNCNFGCTSATDGGALYTNSAGKCIANVDWQRYVDAGVTTHCLTDDATPQDGIIWNDALIANMKLSECKVEWWPKPNATYCAGKTDCRYDTVFKEKCPDAYSWQFDDHSSTYTCKGLEYEVVFGATP